MKSIANRRRPSIPEMTEFADQPTVLYFWAEWHEPSTSLRQVVEALSAKHPSLRFQLLDADLQTELCTQHGVSVVPTLLCLLR